MYGMVCRNGFIYVYGAWARGHRGGVEYGMVDEGGGRERKRKESLMAMSVMDAAMDVDCC